MQDTFARATHSATRPSARDDRVSCIQTSNLLVTLPLVRTELAKRNFLFQASELWNALIGKLINECRPNSNVEWYHDLRFCQLF